MGSGFCIDLRTVVKVDFYFCNLSTSNFEPGADIDGFAGVRFRSHMLNHIAENRICTSLFALISNNRIIAGQASKCD
jgi:hypothetical protein